MEHWLSTALKILEADTSDLRKLAAIAGGDPKTFYRGTRLTDVDITGQDVSGMEFKGGWTSQSQSVRGATSTSEIESRHKFTAEAEFGGQKPEMDRFYEAIQRRMSLRQYAAAAKELLQAVELFPDEPIFLKMLATAARRLNDSELLGSALEAAYNKFSSESWVILQYSFYLVTQDRVKEAIVILRGALQVSTSPGEILELLALLGRADKFEAIDAYREQLALSRGTSFYSRAAVELAELYFQTRQFEEGLKVLMDAASLTPPKKARFFEVLAHAIGLRELQDVVISVFRDAVRRAGAQLPPILPFINGLAKSGLNAQALDLLHEFSQVALSSSSVRELADAYWRLGEHKAAIKFLERNAREKPGRPNIIIALIVRLLEMGDVSNAIFEARTALQGNTGLPPRLLKKFLPFCKDVPEIVELLEAMREQYPDDFGVTVILAKAYSIMGRGKNSSHTWSVVAEAIKAGWHPPKWILRLIANDEAAKRIAGLRDLHREFEF